MRRILSALFVCFSLQLVAMGQEVVPSTPTVVESARQPTIFHSGWAGLDASGNVRGQVVTVGDGGQATPQPGAMVELVSANGLVAAATADENGNFILANVQPGVYELSSSSATSTAVHAVQVLAHNPAMQLDAVSIYASSLSRAQVDEILRGLFVPAPAASPAFGPMQEPPMPIAQSQRVALSNGMVHGRLAFSHGYGSPESHTVKLIKNGQAVDTVSVDGMGMFSIRPTGPGAYDLVVGGIGHGVLGLEVVDDSQPALTANGTEGKFVAAKAANALVQQSLMVPVSMPAGQQQPGGPMIVEELAGPPVIGGGFPAGGGFAGGGGYGGGGAGGGGGFGGAGALLGAAGLAVGIAALSDNDNGFNVNLATPVQ